MLSIRICLWSKLYSYSKWRRRQCDWQRSSSIWCVAAGGELHEQGCIVWAIHDHCIIVDASLQIITLQ